MMLFEYCRLSRGRLHSWSPLEEALSRILLEYLLHEVQTDAHRVCKVSEYGVVLLYEHRNMMDQSDSIHQTE